MVVSFSTGQLSAQFCSGNKGINIFTEGDFGRGSDNILQTDPQIAPGYNYVTNDPVQDGQYTITNGLAPWTSINGWGWLRPKDDSPDPEGYMMVINASYEPGLFYEEEITGLCENSLFEFTARIINLLAPGENKIRPNVDFLIDGVAIYNTGNIPENGRWNTYGFAFSTQPGQTSVTLALRNNAPGGIGNDLALDNIKFQACGPTAEILPNQIAFACEDSSAIVLDATITGNQYTSPTYQWQFSNSQGAVWQDLPGDTNSVFTHTQNAGGLYYYRYLLANSRQNLQNAKCRIVSNTKLVRITPKFTNITDTICEGLSYLFGTQSIDTGGIFVDSLVTFFGCDSIVTLRLAIAENLGIESVLDIEKPSCPGKEDASITISAIIDGQPEYEIFIDSIPLNKNETFGNLSVGNYNLSIIDKYGCRLDTFFTIDDPETFVVDLGSDVKVNLGESVLINTNSNYPISQYTWTPDLSECKVNCESISILPFEDTYFKLSALSDKECSSRDSIFIEVNKFRPLFIPNVFTPNGDLYNSHFNIVGSFPNIKSIDEFLIYDRWENEVVNLKNIDFSSDFIGWDGNDRPAGVYFYSIKVRFLDDFVENYKGFIHLVK